MTGRIKDAHPGGPDGIGWTIERFAGEMKTELHALAALSEEERKIDANALP